MTRYLLPFLFAALQGAPVRYTGEYWAGPEGSRPNGVAIDDKGNVLGRVGLAADMPFYWPAGGVPAVPAHPNAIGWAPRAMDGKGRMYFDRAGQVAVLEGGVFTKRELTDGAFHYLIGAAGDGLGAGFIAGGRFTATRWRSGVVAALPQETDGARALALAINEKGIAAGLVRRVGELLCEGKAEPAQPGRAAYWKDVGAPVVLNAPRSAKWHPQAVKAINSGGWMAGITSPVEPTEPGWLRRREAAEGVDAVATYCEFDLPATRGFVARGRTAKLLPAPPDEEQSVIETMPMAINGHRVIAGTRADAQSVRAVLWQPRFLGWTAALIDRIVDGAKPAGCIETLHHIEARAINERGQLTGTAVCGGRWFAFRLTPSARR